MSQRLFNFIGLFMLLYIWNHINDWWISIDLTTIIGFFSSYIIKMIHKTPFVLIKIAFIILIILYMYSILTEQLESFVYGLTIVISTIGMIIYLNIYFLNETTYLIFFNVHHPAYPPLSMDFKVGLFLTTFENTLDRLDPALLNDSVIREYLHLQAQNIVTNLQILNTSDDIMRYAKTLAEDFWWVRQAYRLSVFYLVFSCVLMIYLNPYL